MAFNFTSLQFWPGFTCVAIVLFTGFIAWLTHQTNRLLKEIEPTTNVLLSGPETAGRLFLAGVCLFLAWLSGLPASQLGLKTGNWGHSLAIGLLAGALTQLAVNLLTVQAIKHFGRHIYSPWLILNILPRRPLEWFLAVAALLPAVAMEELLFRVLWLGVAGTVLPLGLLVVATSLLFGWMHQPQGKLGMALAGGINLVFSLLFLWTGQLLVTLLAHYTVNLLQLGVAHRLRDQLEQHWPQSVDKTPGR